MALNILVFYGSVRSARQGIHAARYITGRCRARGHDARLVDPAESRLPLLDKMFKEFPAGQAPEPLQSIGNLVVAADAYIVVSGEYNHAPPPALTNLLDHFLDEYFWKPSAIVSYSAGGFGGVRAAVALRPMLAEMGMPSIPSTLPISHIDKAFDDRDEPTDPKLQKRAERFLGELEWYGEALRAARLRDGKQAGPARSFCEALEHPPR